MLFILEFSFALDFDHTEIKFQIQIKKILAANQLDVSLACVCCLYEITLLLNCALHDLGLPSIAATVIGRCTLFGPEYCYAAIKSDERLVITDSHENDFNAKFWTSMKKIKIFELINPSN